MAEVANTAGVSDLPTASTSSRAAPHESTAATSPGNTSLLPSRMGSSVLGLGLFMGCDEQTLDNSKDEGDKDKDDDDEDDSTRHTTEHTTTLPSQESNLRKRRVEASPEKFNTGEFEPLQPQSLTTTKRSRANDGTPRAVFASESGQKQTQLTAILSNFNITPNPTNQALDIVQQKKDPPTTGLPIPQTTLKSQLTAGLTNLTFTTPKAYTIPLSALTTPTAKPVRKPRHFSLISAFCANNDLLLLLTSYLTIPSLLSLYATSKEYHHQLNVHMTAHMLALTRTLAPKSELVFPWRCYKKLCIKDPRLRQKSRLMGLEDVVDRRYDDLRDVPSLRWAQMAVYRHAVCKDVLIQLARYGHRCPPGTLMTLKVSGHLLSRSMFPIPPPFGIV